VAERLPAVAAELARTAATARCTRPRVPRGGFAPADDDDELQLLLKDHEGLFARIVELVSGAIGGDE